MRGEFIGPGLLFILAVFLCMDVSRLAASYLGLPGKPGSSEFSEMATLPGALIAGLVFFLTATLVRWRYIKSEA